MNLENKPIQTKSEIFCIFTKMVEKLVGMYYSIIAIQTGLGAGGGEHILYLFVVCHCCSVFGL